MSERVDQLARRVRWVDRYRRLVAICVGLVVAPLVYSQMPSDWPGLHAGGVFVTCGVLAWWLVEVALAGLAALWETECDALTRSHGLPRAIVRK